MNADSVFSQEEKSQSWHWPGFDDQQYPDGGNGMLTKRDLWRSYGRFYLQFRRCVALIGAKYNANGKCSSSEWKCTEKQSISLTAIDNACGSD